MVASFDSETGEEISSTSDRFCGALLDFETGECVGDELDEETGVSWTKKTKFSVPRFYLTKTAAPARRKVKKHCLDSRRSFTLSSKRRVMNLKEKIILGYNKTSPRLFLMPSLFLIPQIAAIVIMISEITLHIWSHRKNHRNSNPETYYRSPLHSLTSQFCRICQEKKVIQHGKYRRKKNKATKVE